MPASPAPPVRRVRSWQSGALGRLAALLVAGAAPAARAVQVETPSRGNESQVAEESAERKVVTVTAEGYDSGDALKQALRKALEQGAGVQIASYTKVQNFELARDTIYSRASGIITEYKILKQEETAGGGVVVTVEAVVRASAVAQTWGEVQNVLDQLGRPKIMVWIDETIDHRPQSDSIVETRLEEMFVKAGFDLVSRKGVEELARREHADALKEGNEAKLAAIAKNAGAHIYIRGSANANRAGVENLYGVPAAFYNCDVQARVYYTDTARLIASESLPNTRAGVRSQKEHSPQAARTALAQATLPPENYARNRPYLAQKLYESVMEQWSTQLTAGGEIALDIEGLDFATFMKVKKALAEIENVDSVNGDFTKGVGAFRLRAKISAETLAERLTQKPFAEWLDVTDLKPNRIQAKRR